MNLGRSVVGRPLFMEIDMVKFVKCLDGEVVNLAQVSVIDWNKSLAKATLWGGSENRALGQTDFSSYGGIDGFLDHIGKELVPAGIKIV